MCDEGVHLWKDSPCNVLQVNVAPKLGLVPEISVAQWTMVEASFPGVVRVR